MAFRKRPAEGENAGGFVSVGPNGDNRDPTQGPPSGSRGSIYKTTDNPYGGDRFGQVDRGSKDNSGANHDS